MASSLLELLVEEGRALAASEVVSNETHAFVTSALVKRLESLGGDVAEDIESTADTIATDTAAPVPGPAAPAPLAPTPAAEEPAVDPLAEQKAQELAAAQSQLAEAQARIAALQAS